MPLKARMMPVPITAPMINQTNIANRNFIRAHVTHERPEFKSAFKALLGSMPEVTVWSGGLHSIWERCRLL